MQTNTDQRLLHQPPAFKPKYNSSKISTGFRKFSNFIKTCRFITSLILFLTLSTICLTVLSLFVHLLVLPTTNAELVQYNSIDPDSLPHQKEWKVFRGMTQRIANVSWSDTVVFLKFTRVEPTSSATIRNIIKKSYPVGDVCNNIPLTIPDIEDGFSTGDILIMQKVSDSVLMYHNSAVYVPKDEKCVEQFDCIVKFFSVFK